jgi:SAM-dependent methyltransferase
LVFLDPLPADLSRFYAGGYQPIPASVKELRAMAAPERYRLEPVQDKAGGELLEIGPWIGLFSINAKDAGFNVSAIEMSAPATDFLVNIAGIPTVNSDDSAAALLSSAKRYDVIALWHSLEHLPRPWEVLAAASQRLKPGGRLLVAIPNIDSWQARVLGSRWLHLDAPRHLYFWSPDDLAKLIQGFGLQALKLDTHDRLSDQLARNAWEWHVREAVRVPIVRGVTAKLSAAMITWLTPNARRGAGLTAIFQAPS